MENAASELSNGPSAQAGALHQELLDLLAAAASLLAVPVTRMAVPARSLLQHVSSALHRSLQPASSASSDVNTFKVSVMVACLGMHMHRCVARYSKNVIETHRLTRLYMSNSSGQ